MAKPIRTSPVLDTLAEVQVQTANYSARYGTTGGAVINAVTKSGTGAVPWQRIRIFPQRRHGRAQFLQPDRTPLKQNQFGFTIGGPVIFAALQQGPQQNFLLLERGLA